jgi:hypothetical protein
VFACVKRSGKEERGRGEEGAPALSFSPHSLPVECAALNDVCMLTCSEQVVKGVFPRLTLFFCFPCSINGKQASKTETTFTSGRGERYV